MLTRIKQFFCEHYDITTTTESSSPEHIFIVKTTIQCNICKKTFTQHPNATCCYVQHLHSKILTDYWLEKLKQGQQI